MTQRINVLLIDDIDGGEASETIPFGLDDTYYEIDLNSAHAGELRELMAPYVQAGRKAAGPGGRSARARRTNGNPAKSKEIRDWARGRGLEVNDRGRIPADIAAKYEAEIGM